MKMDDMPDIHAFLDVVSKANENNLEPQYFPTKEEPDFLLNLNTK